MNINKDIYNRGQKQHRLIKAWYQKVKWARKIAPILLLVLNFKSSMCCALSSLHVTGFECAMFISPEDEVFLVHPLIHVEKFRTDNVDWVPPPVFALLDTGVKGLQEYSRPIFYVFLFVVSFNYQAKKFCFLSLYHWITNSSLLTNFSKKYILWSELRAPKSSSGQELRCIIFSEA